MNKKYKASLVLGKFCPLHNGHVSVINKASEESDIVYVVVDNIMDDVIPVQRRMEWVKAEFRNAVVLTQDHSLPQYPEECENFWEIWRNTLRDLIPEKIEAVYGSETYVNRLAQELEAHAEIVDLNREIVSISATDIRTQIAEKWHFLPPVVKKDLMLKVCVFGPESCGKSTLTQQLAQHYGVPYATEYAYDFLVNSNGNVTKEEMREIAKGQEVYIRKACDLNEHLIFSDTDAIATKIWTLELFDCEDNYVNSKADESSFDLYLVMYPDLEWKDDVHRLRPNTRMKFYEKCIAELEARNFKYVTIKGLGEDRLNNAIKAVEQLISNRLCHIR